MLDFAHTLTLQQACESIAGFLFSLRFVNSTVHADKEPVPAAIAFESR